MSTRIRKAKLDPHHQQMSWYLAQNGISNLYHFTSIYNLRRIFDCRRVYSRDQLIARHMHRDVEFGDKAQSHGGIGDQRVEAHVSLSYYPGLPMAYNLEQGRHLCYLVFSMRVALTDGVFFSDRNAASMYASWERGMVGLRQVDFDAVHAKKARRNSDEHVFRQAEVLVQHAIPASEIEYVAFRSPASLDEARRQCDGIDNLPLFRLEPRFFHLYESYEPCTGVISARLVNRHPFRNMPMRLMSENELDRLLTARSVEGCVVEAKNGICLIQTLKVCSSLAVTVKWWHESSKAPLKTVELPTRRSPVVFGVQSVAATLGPKDLQPGNWRVESYVSSNVKQLEISFYVR